jgi:hypothetical protein
MQCPTCHDRMTTFPGCPSGVSHCHTCGTLRVGSDAYPAPPIVPTVVQLMEQSQSQCLRGDRGQCAVWALAANKLALGDVP